MFLRAFHTMVPPLQFGLDGMHEVAAFDTVDGLYDCCWSEVRIPVCLCQLPIVARVEISNTGPLHERLVHRKMKTFSCLPAVMEGSGCGTSDAPQKPTRCAALRSTLTRLTAVHIRVVLMTITTLQS